MDCGPKQKVGSGIPEWCGLQTQPAHPTFAAQKADPGSSVWWGQETQPVCTTLAAQRTGSGSQQTNIARSKGRTGVLIEGRCTNLGSAHNSPWAQLKEQVTPMTKSADADTKQVHINPMTLRPARGAGTSAHKPHDHAECAPVKLRQVHTSQRHRGWTSGNWESSAHSLWHRGWAKGAEGSPHKSLQRRRIHTSTYLASFGQERRAGQGNRSTSNDPRDK